jgi:hypothetical protein
MPWVAAALFWAAPSIRQPTTLAATGRQAFRTAALPGMLYRPWHHRRPSPGIARIDSL